jgi:hypothetical protein
LIRDFGEVNFGEIEAIGDILEGGVVFDSAVNQVVGFAGDRIILLKEHLFILS